ncbi:uncharacterized protein F5147DRAFT_758107 [Suillus discolor]|uniref:Uncharacterized protein n=1 Tax=Suillus discolor TaxID=1912936 RepID=A0A9P7FEW8_9AGAM|nr:uncharacterized protein F5147DRAFT_758107 [Suillus discolor]KAG2116461.1 hypothetical protein F5147DRAFT_758107 [Suillus discolor]
MSWTPFLCSVPATVISISVVVELEWLKERWQTQDVQNARKWILQASWPGSNLIGNRTLSITAGAHQLNSDCLSIFRSASTTTSSTSTIPPTPIIVSETMMRSPTPETTEERIRKELEQDRKDAECELKMQVYNSKRLNAQQI